MSKNELKQFDFNDSGIEQIRNLSYGRNWPVVYVINGEKEAYVGETNSAYRRMKQHQVNPNRKKLNKVNIIYDSQFNKSAILDIESLLINYMAADQKFKLQNMSSGVNEESNYYLRDEYLKKFDNIWKSLMKQGLVDHERIVLENLDIFKYSPYKSLTIDQHLTAIDILELLVENKNMNKKATFIVNGAPGTGKSVLAVYLMKLLNDCKKSPQSIMIEENMGYLSILGSFLQYFGNVKIGLVVPMDSFRKSLKNVFKHVDGLKAKMVMSPSQVVREHYDILIVDEAHRLRRRVNLVPGLAHRFDVINDALKIDNGDELDWIIKSSDYQILFYDPNQSVRPSDIRRKKFKEIENKIGTVQFILTSQMRVKGGDYYISSIYKLLNQELNHSIECDDYDLKLFDDVDEMFQTIKKHNKEYSLCRMVAGYSWPWNTKEIDYGKIKKEHLYDIEIGSYRYIWNHTNKDWVNTSHSINEIGCIHTIQGYDLNYVGVIIGNELKYDVDNNKIYVDKRSYFDIKGKSSIESEHELFQYIINIYKVLLTRGILGTYIYVLYNLRSYFKRWIK